MLTPWHSTITREHIVREFETASAHTFHREDRQCIFAALKLGTLQTADADNKHAKSVEKRGDSPFLLLRV